MTRVAAAARTIGRVAFRGDESNRGARECDAAHKLTGFSRYVETHGGADVPDIPVANDPATLDVAGLLRSGAETLKPSLGRKRAGPP